MSKSNSKKRTSEEGKRKKLERIPYIPQGLRGFTEIFREDVGGGLAWMSLEELEEMPTADAFFDEEHPPRVLLIPHYEEWRAEYLDGSSASVEQIPDVLTCPNEVTYAAAPREWYLHRTARLSLRLVVPSVKGPAAVRLRTAGREVISARSLGRAVERVVTSPTPSQLEIAQSYMDKALVDLDDVETTLFRVSLELPGQIGDLAREIAERDEGQREFDRSQGRPGSDLGAFYLRLWDGWDAQARRFRSL